jgi:glycosyltransferase involved in cell wall biosynthesis
MRIVIDMQGAQASNGKRGIGRYTLALSQAIAQERGTHEVLLALNGALPEWIPAIRAAFDGLLPPDAIRVWDCPAPLAYAETANTWRRRSAELLREAFLASLAPDMVLVSSLFEGLGDDAVTSVGTLSANVPTAVILYDLIPFIRRQPYLDNPVVEAWYENKIGHLRRANLLLAISASSRQEGIDHLGLPPASCIEISTAADAHFRSETIAPEQADALRQRHGLTRPFVMYTGGIDHRKNIEGLIRAFALLPDAMRNSHQLAIVCSAQPAARDALTSLAKKLRLAPDALVLTGYVPEDDLVALYNLCKAFVFPSLHEGFGLPALEAMACGRAVIAANTSSLPEVIGRDDALFDPTSDADIADKIAQVLGDDAFRAALEQHGLKQAQRFSWTGSARRTLRALETWHAGRTPVPIAFARRPKLAYVSPLAPLRSGISDYSAELLPELHRHYDIDVIVAQDQIDTPWIRANCPVRTVAWFRQHAASYDRVLYHFGNSEFHQHMFGLLEEIPGCVVLHDFFLSGVVAHMDVTGYRPGYWARQLYDGHGYAALAHRFHVDDTADVVWAYPCNTAPLQGALGVIVHSENSRRLATAWHGAGVAQDWHLVPHLRVAEPAPDSARARSTLGIGADDFVVCSFGLLGPSKLNDRLLAAWLASALAADPRSLLVFVGENQQDAYGQELVAAIRRSGLGARVRITGWADTATFRNYLAAADVGVQLRTKSRGETSGTVLDCMNYALPVIVNANGSMADLPADGVWSLPDEFENTALTAALESLWKTPARRQALGARARQIILDQHAPRACATGYAHAIETSYAKAASNGSALAGAVGEIAPAPREEAPWIAFAQAAARSIAAPLHRRQLLLDISELVQRDAKSGIQRVVRSILHALLDNPPAGYRVEPVYASTTHGYRYARAFTLGLLDCPANILEDDPIDYQPGDVFLGLDLQPQVVPAQQAFYRHLRLVGVHVQFVVYDLLPITLAHAFPPGAEEGHSAWLRVVAESDGAVCISAAVASELQTWLDDTMPARTQTFKITSFHLGADIDSSLPSLGLPPDATTLLTQLQRVPTFLMVGTIEPRKEHAQVLAAVELLWARGEDVNLVIVGKQGWMMEALIERLNRHAELNHRLFWLNAISDEFLKQVYEASACLIAASSGEGFGLPLIEAAQYKLPIIARDIPVFREVASQHSTYFEGTTREELANALASWLAGHRTGTAVPSHAMPWLTWDESTRQLLDALGLHNVEGPDRNTIQPARRQK